jgi:hypothetical protein
MGMVSDSPVKSELTVAIVALGLLGGGLHGLQKGIKCNLKEIYVEKPGNETIRFSNPGSYGVTLEIKKSQYEDGVFEFATAKETLVELEKGEEKSISLEDNKIMQYTVQGCRAESQLVRYGEIDPYDGGPDVSNTLERYN